MEGLGGEYWGAGVEFSSSDKSFFILSEKDDRAS